MQHRGKLEILRGPTRPYAQTPLPRLLKRFEQCYWRSYTVLEASSLRAVSLQTTHACPRLPIWPWRPLKRVRDSNV